MVRLAPKAQWGPLENWQSVPEVEHGLTISVDLQALIDQIVVAPGAKWLELVTQKVINRYHLPVHVKCTDLDADLTY